MHVESIESHQHAATITTGSLRVQVRGFRDSTGREYDEVVITSLGEYEPESEVHGRQTRIFRVPLPVAGDTPV